jgi:hypothetical protein
VTTQLQFIIIIIIVVVVIIIITIIIIIIIIIIILKLHTAKFHTKLFNVSHILINVQSLHYKQTFL